MEADGVGSIGGEIAEREEPWAQESGVTDGAVGRFDSGICRPAVGMNVFAFAAIPDISREAIRADGVFGSYPL